MSFTPRLSAPSTSDKNWIHTSKGGKNSCILIKGNSVLPNCVGYAWGRFMEILGSTPKLSRRNAEDWYGYTADGYRRGNTPKLGAVICWRKGKTGTGSDGAGHVAIVEKINSDGSIVISQSGYNSKRFWTSTIKSGYALSGYVFQGFIYNPAVSVTTTTNKKSNNEIAKEVIAGKWGNGSERKKKLTAAGYDYDAIQKIVNNMLSGTTTTNKKSNNEIAKEVIAGKWGNGSERKKKLTAAGYDYDAIQKIVNSMLSGTTTTNKKSNNEIAKEVIAGKWGNGADRKNKLTAAGYNYDAIQKIVNGML